jgi:hypothetical protein
MIVRLVADMQNRLFWRVGAGRASECCVRSAGWSQASRDRQRPAVLQTGGCNTVTWANVATAVNMRTYLA